MKTHDLLCRHLFFLRLQTIQRSRQPLISETVQLEQILLLAIGIQGPRKDEATHLQAFFRPSQRGADLSDFSFGIVEHLSPALRKPLLWRIHFLQHNVQHVEVRLGDAKLGLKFSQKLGWRLHGGVWGLEIGKSRLDRVKQFACRQEIMGQLRERWWGVWSGR